MAQAIPIVELLLVVLGMALFVLELKAPGSFVFAGLAAVLFVLFFWMQAEAGAPLIGIAVALFLLGLALIGVELTVLPAHVVPGVVGLLLVLAAWWSPASTAFPRFPATGKRSASRYCGPA